MKIIFRKTGKQIKSAVQNRCTQLEQRLERRNQALESLLQDTRKVRSYLLRSTQVNWGHGSGQRGYELYGKDDISSEEQEEIAQLCRRIFEIEQELRRLALIARHLDDDQVFELSFEELVGYGFNVDE